MKISKYQNRILAIVIFFVFFFGLITVIYIHTVMKIVFQTMLLIR